MQDTQQPKRYQCRHIFTDGTRCGSPCLRGEEFCYYHHTTRSPIQNPAGRQGRRASFDIPLPEDRSAIQASIGRVLQRIATNQIDPKRAGLLLYGLQIASLNLPKPETTIRSRNSRQSARESRQTEVVEEITTHPKLGTLAPVVDLNDIETRGRKTAMQLLMEAMMMREKEEPKTPPATTPSPNPTQNIVISTEPRAESRGSGEPALSEVEGTCFSTTNPSHPNPSTTSQPEPQPTTLPTVQATSSTQCQRPAKPRYSETAHLNHRQTRRRPAKAPKARHIPAWGEAPGNRPTKEKRAESPAHLPTQSPDYQTHPNFG